MLIPAWHEIKWDRNKETKESSIEIKDSCLILCACVHRPYLYCVSYCQALSVYCYPFDQKFFPRTRRIWIKPTKSDKPLPLPAPLLAKKNRYRDLYNQVKIQLTKCGIVLVNKSSCCKSNQQRCKQKWKSVEVTVEPLLKTLSNELVAWKI